MIRNSQFIGVARKSFLATLTFFYAITASAETKPDEGLWFMLAGQGGLGVLGEDLRDFRWWLDVQPRFSEDADGLGQTLVRPGLGYAFGNKMALWAGYAWILTERSSGPGHIEEHRIWQQLTWSLDVKRLNLASRTRLEQRFVETGDEVGWRFRQFVKGMLPIAANSRIYLAAYDEFFADLNDTRWGQDVGISQNRFFLGLGRRFDVLPQSRPLSLEAGYLNQYIDQASRADRINHILSINLLLSF